MGEQLTPHVRSFLPPDYDPFTDPDVIVGNTLECYSDEADLSLAASRFPLDALAAVLPAGAERVRILEIGCSNGRNLKLLAEVVRAQLGESVAIEAYGVDIVAELLLVAERRLTDAGLARVELHALDWERQPLAFDARFDLVVSSKVLYNTALKLDPGRLRQVHDALAPGGAFFLEAYRVRGWRDELRLLGRSVRGRPYGNATRLDLARLSRWARALDWELFYRAWRQGAWTHHVRNLTTWQFIWRRPAGESRASPAGPPAGAAS